MDSTADGGDDYLREYAQAKPVPGLVVIVQAGRPAAATLAIPKQGTELGRGTPQGLLAEDEQVSRGHVRIGVHDGTWTIEDLGSRNGTFVDGVRLTGSISRAAPALLRLGRSLVWLVDDVRPFLGQHHVAQTQPMGPVLGGLSRRALGEIAIASKAGDTLLIIGESGAGKEMLAHAFHEAHFGPGSKAPLVAVNCAAIPEGLAERLLFGAKRGAFSGATDAEGYLQEAHGGTLFLDEVAELDLLVQAKLLRVFETREVLALGATSPRKVQIRICAATHKDLRLAANAGEFRPDLYYRIGRPEVRIPPLRERIDEIPWLLQRVLGSADERGKLTASVGLVEACALRPWPGNVRELLHEGRRAAHAALAEGVDSVRPDHLAPEAGLELGHGRSSGPAKSSAPPLEDSAIEAALEQNAGNVTRAAKALGLHRNQLRRWLAKRTGSGQPPSDD
jgi:DNA-binding NtrC family response regulator